MMAHSNRQIPATIGVTGNKAQTKTALLKQVLPFKLDMWKAAGNREHNNFDSHACFL